MKVQIGGTPSTSRLLSIVAAVLVSSLLLLSAAAHAQSYSGSIRGTVIDPSGSAIVGASVTLRNIGSNATSQTTTTDIGAFSFPNVNVGTYEVTVKAPNFKEFVARSVDVHVSTATEINAKLELGSTSEIVTVEATDVQVQTTSAEVGAVIEGTQVRELPLNGRNFMALTQLQPGVSANNNFNAKDKGLQGGSDFSVNGNPSTNNLFLIDGVNNNDVGSNRTILIYPSVDAVAEFKMLTNSYGPEYGQASGAIISITTRTGTNAFHGGVFYEGRNDALNAAGFIANSQNQPKASLRRNDWGYFVGGPVIKDKLFFWFNEEWNRDIRGQLISNCVPTAAERGGDFSADVTAALTSLNSGGSATATTTCNAPAPATFTNTAGANQPPNYVATSNIPVGFQAPGNPFAIANPDAVGKLLADYYPLPNQTGIIPGTPNFNYASAAAGRVPWREENARVDFDVTKTQRLSFRYTQDSWKFPAPNNAFGWGDTNFATYQGNWDQPSKSIMAKLTSQLGSTMTNDFEFGYAHNAIIVSPGGDNPTLGSQFDTASPPVWPASGKTAGGFPTVWSGLNQYGNFSSIWAIVGYGNHMDLFTWQDNVTKIHGNHVWKFGGLFSHNAKQENQFGGQDRTTFSLGDPGWGETINTGNVLADVLLPGTGTPLAFTDPACNANNGATAVGCPQQIRGVSEANVNPVDKGRWHDIEFYAGDTWKVSRRVTLNYGFRWSMLREPYAADDRMASFDLAAYDPSRPAGDACNGVVLVPGTNFCSDAAGAVGLPLSSGTPGVNRALVANNYHNIGPRLGVAWDVFGTGKTALRVGGGQFFQRERVSPQVGLTNTAPFAINAGGINRTLDEAPPLSGASTSPANGRSPRAVTPNTWQWNFSIEQELARNTALQVGYVGNAGIHQTSTYDINQVSESGFGLGAFLPNSPNGATPSINSLRPASNFGAINYFSRDGHSSYHALQVMFRSKLKNFSTIQAAYTWSHTIADIEEDAANGGASQGSFTDIQNLGLDRGNATINRPNIFVLNEVFFLPKLAGQNSIVKGVAGGWEVNTIFTAENGNSMSVYQNGLSQATALLIPAAKDPNVPFNNCTNGTTVFPCSLGSLSGTGYNNNNRPNIVPGVGCNSDTNGAQQMNPNAFTLIGYAIGTVGNAPRGICQGPHYVNADFGIYKNWSIKEKVNLRFSMDFFNAFNHTNFDANGVQGVGNQSGTFYNGSGVYCGAANGGGLYQPCSPTNNVISAYGSTSATRGGASNTWGIANQIKPPRELQFGLKITF